MNRITIQHSPHHVEQHQIRPNKKPFPKTVITLKLAAVQYNMLCHEFPLVGTCTSSFRLTALPPYGWRFFQCLRPNMDVWMIENVGNMSKYQRLVWYDQSIVINTYMCSLWIFGDSKVLSQMYNSQNTKIIRAVKLGEKTIWKAESARNRMAGSILFPSYNLNHRTSLQNSADVNKHNQRLDRSDESQNLLLEATATHCVGLVINDSYRNITDEDANSATHLFSNIHFRSLKHCLVLLYECKRSNVEQCFLAFVCLRASLMSRL